LQTVFSQGLINGTVVDVIDGRTLVVSNASEKKINVRLRYLEVPEPEQQLSDVVKNHLKDLALGKKIYVTKVQIFANYTLGVGMINERESKFDLTQQMIRDGAGWFDVYDASAASDESTSDYQETEQLAKNEKRGVWGIADMKTPWQYRDENNAKNTVVVAVKTDSVEKKPDEMSIAEMVKNSSKSTNGAGRLAIYDFEFKKPTIKEAVAEQTRPMPMDVDAVLGDVRMSLNPETYKQTITMKPFAFHAIVNRQLTTIQADFASNGVAGDSEKSYHKITLTIFTEVGQADFLRNKIVSLILDKGAKVILGASKYYKNKQTEQIVFESIVREDLLPIVPSDSATLVIGKQKFKLVQAQKYKLNDFVHFLCFSSKCSLTTFSH
jgi:endonuclease YncB( thermonuclease family)